METSSHAIFRASWDARIPPLERLRSQGSRASPETTLASPGRILAAREAFPAHLSSPNLIFTKCRSRQRFLTPHLAEVRGKDGGWGAAWRQMCMPGSRHGPHRPEAEEHLCLRGVRPLLAEMAGPVPLLPPLEHTPRGGRGGDTGFGARTGAPRGRRRSRWPCGRWWRARTSGSRPASASSTGCSAAASCRARWCSSAATRASASRRCSSRARPAGEAGRGRPVLYVSGEESVRQVKLRADRLGVAASDLLLLAETDASRDAPDRRPDGAGHPGVDSIQTVYLPELASAPGTVTQVREVAARLMAYAKAREIAGLPGRPRHQGRRHRRAPRPRAHGRHGALLRGRAHAQPYRILRAHKNRFGSTSEIGVFEMKAGGLAEVANPSALFLAERPRARRAPSPLRSRGRARSSSRCRRWSPPPASAPRAAPCWGSTRSGWRCWPPCSRRGSGSISRAATLFVNVAGGTTLDDPAADLATWRRWPRPPRGGDRGAHPGARRGRAGRRGARGGPGRGAALRGGAAGIPAGGGAGRERARHAEAPAGMEVVGVETVEEALERLL